MAAMFFIAACFSGNYLILMNDHFIVKSVLCPFLKTTLYYKEVHKIKFKNTMGGIYIEIHQNPPKIKRLFLGCVKEKDLLEVADLLKKKGIEVDDRILICIK